MPSDFDREFAYAADPVPWILESFEGGGGSAGMKVRVEGSSKEKTLWCSADYLGLGADAEVREQARAAMEKFTVGSCGPRGFYGTTTAHLDLEHSLAAFMQEEEAISYSDSTSTIASVIPAFAKRGDVLLIDSEANFGIQQGARLSRSKVVWWEHNNTKDLERHLLAVKAMDEQRRAASGGILGGGGGASPSEQRRFIVVEGLYASSGSLAPLPEVCRLAREYRWRVVLDDSAGFGVLGGAGRGTPEHYGMKAGEGPCVTVGSLATALGGVGGFCVGSREVVDHQRLSGVGYCFSASAPPYLCASASAALAALRQRPHLTEDLRKSSAALHAELCAEDIAEGFEVVSHPLSPTKHLRVSQRGLRRGFSGGGGAGAPAAAAAESSSSSVVEQAVARAAEGLRLTTPPSTPSRAAVAARMLSPTTQKLPPPDARQAKALDREEALIDRVVALAADKGVLITRLHVIPGEPVRARPSLKFHLTLRHTQEDKRALLTALREIVAQLF